jgi:hypothetical protein
MSDQTRNQFRTRWTAKRDVFAEAGALVDGARLLDHVLADVEAVFASEEAETLTVAEAARESGYTRDHVARLIRSGTIPNAGRPRAPRVRRGDLPRKPSKLPTPPPHPHLVGADPVQVARSVVTSHSRGAR